MALYDVHYDGRATASGEIYQKQGLTAAHESLPLGTMIRVANFETGRMVDVRVNDRKPRNHTILTVSERAGRELGIPMGGAATASFSVLSTTSQPLNSASAGNSLFSGSDSRSVQKGPFAGLGGLFEGKKEVGPKPVPSSAYPQGPYQTTAVNSAPTYVPQVPAQKKQGFTFSGLFGGKNQASTNQGVSQATGSPTLPPTSSSGYPSPNRELVPLNAHMSPTPQASLPAPEVMARPQPSSFLPGPPAASPYRVQFGAYRRSSNAYETSGVLTRSGVGNMVVQSPTTQLFLVVSSAGFQSAHEAQRWIDVESSRRGWRERPVVVR
ncbi:MAG: RlpA-like double-psi beta-barrel domain-containing protein [Verrucomicrobiota bacterium]